MSDDETRTDVSLTTRPTYATHARIARSGFCSAVDYPPRGAPGHEAVKRSMLRFAEAHGVAPGGVMCNSRDFCPFEAAGWTVEMAERLIASAEDDEAWNAYEAWLDARYDQMRIAHGDRR